MSGQVDDDTVQQTMIARCGAADIVHDHPDHDHGGLHRYHIAQYPDPVTSLSLLSSDKIDNVVLAASQLWNDADQVRLMPGRGDTADVLVVFCDMDKCVKDRGEEEVARPERDPATGIITIYLDSQQSWADQDNLAAMAYGAAFDVHMQLLQVEWNRENDNLYPFIYTLGDGSPVWSRAGPVSHQQSDQRHGALLL